MLWGPVSQLLIHDIVGTEAAAERGASQLNEPAVGRFFSTRRWAAVLMLLLSPSMGLVVNTLIYLPLTLVVVDCALHRP